MRLLAIWGLGGGGGDLARTTFPRLLPLETVSRPGEARALVYPLAAGGLGGDGGDRATRTQSNRWREDGDKRLLGCILRQLEAILKIIPPKCCYFKACQTSKKEERTKPPMMQMRISLFLELVKYEF